MATTNTVADIVVQALKKFKVKCDSIYMKFTDTKNDLNSTSTNTPLSANQGKVLADKITTTNTNIGTLSSLTTSVKTSIVNAINSLVTAVDGKAPTSHASTGTTYGVGTTTSYGHVKTINSLTQSSHQWNFIKCLSREST